ncbi:MAG: hypothetical protein J1F22_05335 [Lachnospiraceae bacterium]|nr:hypothetical protein [Lachnospiraceae bacterium]
MQKKKIIIVILFLLGILIIITVLLIHLYNKHINNALVQKGQDSFRYTHEEHFKGNRWNLYVNEKYTYAITPWLSKEEMRAYLSDVNLIKTIYDEGNVRVYSLPLGEYQSQYDIIYTINGVDFYCWDKDILNIETDNEVKNRLTELYKYIPESELAKQLGEGWE